MSNKKRKSNDTPSAQPDTQSECYDIFETEISPKDAFVLFTDDECSRNYGPYNTDTSLPMLNIPNYNFDDGETKSGNQYAGIKAQVSIVKVRIYTCQTLLKKLKSIDEDKTKPKLITPEIKRYLDNLCTLSSHLFSKTDTNRSEQSGGAPITSRETMKDSNNEMKTLDETMFKLIVKIFIIYKTDAKLKEKAFNILRNFMMTSSVKEYLDTGQLYAIINNTHNHNQDNNWTKDKITERANTRLSGNVINPPTTMPRKPMLETIDGAATRIASNALFTSYCNFTLTDPVTKQNVDSTFYIDNNLVYILSLLISKDVYISTIIDKAFEGPTYVQIKKIIDFFKNIDYDDIIPPEIEANAIDYLYYILNDSGCLEILKHISLNNPIHKVILIPNSLYYMASVASFLHISSDHSSTDDGSSASAAPIRQVTSSIINKLKNDLIECNFDSLCHDNADSSVYRIIMILMFILKNEEGKIMENLNMMGITHNSAINIPEGYETIKDDIENLKRQLTSGQQIIFNELLNKSADSIEHLLYTRLRKKCCYVFPVRSGTCNDYVAIVSCVDSAHYAPTQINDELMFQQFIGNRSVFPITSLHAGMMLPECTNCAIDAPLKHSFSLSTISTKKMPSSNVITTAITLVDAAAVNKDNSEYIKTPICIKIHAYNLLIPLSSTGQQQEHFIFSYKFYGNEPDKTSITQRRLTCKTYICKLTNEILIEFANNNFYAQSGNNYEREIEDIWNYYLRNIADVDVSKDKTIRKMFSDLVPYGVMTRKTNRRNELKEKFIKQFETTFNNDQYKDDRLKLYFYIRILLNIIKETKNKVLSGSTTDEIKEKVGEQFDFAKTYGTRVRTRSGGTKSMVIDNSNVSQPSTVSAEQDSSGVINSSTDNMIPDDSDDSSHEEPSTSSSDYMSEYDEPNNDEYIAPKQLTYYSLFGQYGFDMSVEKGEYILTRITSKDQYNAYISKYNIGTTQLPGVRVTPTMGSSTTTRRVVHPEQQIRTTIPTKQSKNSTVKKTGKFPSKNTRLDRPTQTRKSWYEETLQKVILELAKLQRDNKLDRNTFGRVFKRVRNRELRSNLLSDRNIRPYAQEINLYGGNTRSLKMRKKQTLKRQTKRPRKVTRKQIPRKTLRKTKRKW